jgi:hypothetical protein
LGDLFQVGWLQHWRAVGPGRVLHDGAAHQAATPPSQSTAFRQTDILRKMQRFWQIKTTDIGHEREEEQGQLIGSPVAARFKKNILCLEVQC